MSNIKERLQRGKEILEKIDERRRVEGDPGAASGIERMIVEREISELEKGAAEDSPPSLE